MSDISRRNPSVDIAKFLCAIFVIGIHTRPLSGLSEVADFVLCDIIFRVAVPFFAVCSGYFLTRKLKKSGYNSWVSVKTLAGKTLVLYIIWSCVFLINLVFDWNNLGILTMSSFIGWFKSFLIGESYYHLWYLYQLVIALLLFYPIVKFLHERWQIFLTIFLWTIGVFFKVYSESIGFLSGVIQEQSLLFNLLGRIRILPLLLAGSFLARRTQLNLKLSWSLTFVFLVLLFFEVFFLKSQGVSRFKYELFSLPLAYYLFSSVLQTSIECSFDTRILAKTSLYIYVLHPLIHNVLIALGISSHLLSFIIVSIVSAFVSFVIVSGYNLNSTKSLR